MWIALPLLAFVPSAALLAQDSIPGPAPIEAPATASNSGQQPNSPALGVVKKVDPWRLDLAEARALALRGNLDLRLAEESVQQAHFAYMGSFGAFEWRFRAGANYTDAEREVTSSFLEGGTRIKSKNEGVNFAFERPLRTGGTFDLTFRTDINTTNSAIVESDKQTSDELALSFTQPLLRGGSKDYATADIQEQQVRWQLEVERWRANRQDILAQVDLAYWELLAATDALEVRQSAVQLGEALLVRRGQELDAGMGTELAVLESQADLATRREALLAAQNLRRQREDELKMLLLGADDLERWEQPLETIDEYPLTEAMGRVEGWRSVLGTAVEQRSELRQAESNVRLAEISKSKALSERMAGLDLVLRASSNAVDRNWTRSVADTLDWEAPTYSAQLNYDMPIGNATARYAVQRADSALRSAWIDWEKARRDVVSEVRAAVREVIYRREAMLAADQSLDLAGRNLEQEEARNREGLSTNYQVLEVQQRYVEALSTQRQSRAEWAKAWVNLQKAQGTLEAGPQVVPEVDVYEQAPVLPESAESPTETEPGDGL